MANPLAGFSGYTPLSAPKAAPKPASHHWYDGVTGFIGHLGSDIVHTTTGMPMGILQLIEHPITSSKLMVKATWQDWSPLFHGDVATWEHQTFEHPLAPILDVAGVLSLGAGTAARAAGGVAKLSEITAASDAARAAAQTGKLARFSDPATAAFHEHRLTFLRDNASKAGLKNFDMKERSLTYARDMLTLDKRAGRVATSKGGVNAFHEWSKNPLIRGRQKTLTRLGNEAANRAPKKLHVDKFLGDQAVAKRWATMDQSRRKVATVSMMAAQLGGLRKLGEKLSGMDAYSKYHVLSQGMRDGMRKQANEVLLKPEGKGRTAQLKALRAEGWTGMKSDAQLAADGETTINAILNKKNLTDDQKLQKLFHAWGADHTQGFKNLEGVARGSTPDHILVVKGKGAKNLGREAGASSKTAELLYKKPTQIWKYMVLGLSPRYLVNNVVGNTLMLAMSGNPVGMIKAMHMHISMVHGAKEADKAWNAARLTAKGPAIRKMGGNPALSATEDIAQRQARRTAQGLTINDQIFAGEHLGMSKSEGGLSSMEASTAQNLRSRAKRANFYAITHKLSDTFHRDVMMNYTIMRTEEWQAFNSLALQRGKSGFEARNYATEMAAKSPRVRSFVRENVNHALGQYHHFNSFERTVRGVVPFYSWDRAITRHTAEMVKSRPYQAAMLAAIGARGHQATQDILGNLPDFLQGVIPTEAIAAMGGPAAALTNFVAGNAPHRKGVLLTSGINPYSSIGDIVQSAQAAAGGKARLGDSLGGQINPVLRGGIETLSGTSLTTGAPQTPIAGILGTYLGPLSNLPPIKLGEVLMQKYKVLGMNYPQPKSPTSPFLFAKNAQAQISGDFGLPTRQLSLPKAAALYNKQQGIKKKQVVGLARGSSRTTGPLGNLPGL